MPFRDAGYDHETTALLTSAFDAACAALNLASGELVDRRIVALRIMTAAARGERDPERLRTSAIGNG